MWFRTNGPVVQWIEYKIPVLTIWVRIPSGSRHLPDRSSGRGFFFFRPLRSPRPRLKAAAVPPPPEHRTPKPPRATRRCRPAPHADADLREHTPKPPSTNAVQHSTRHPAYCPFFPPSAPPRSPWNPQNAKKHLEKIKKRKKDISHYQHINVFSYLYSRLIRSRPATVPESRPEEVPDDKDNNIHFS